MNRDQEQDKGIKWTISLIRAGTATHPWRMLYRRSVTKNTNNARGLTRRSGTNLCRSDVRSSPRPLYCSAHLSFPFHFLLLCFLLCVWLHFSEPGSHMDCPSRSGHDTQDRGERGNACCWDMLPPEVVCCIFSFLPLLCMMIARRVCSTWRDPRMWYLVPSLNFAPCVLRPLPFPPLPPTPLKCWFASAIALDSQGANLRNISI